jgi:hypothetical protein
MTNPCNNKKCKGQFVVVVDATTSIIGARSSVQMGFVTVNEQSILRIGAASTPGLEMSDIPRQYPSVFSGEFGCLPGKLHLDVDPAVRPVQLPVRKNASSIQGEAAE